MSKVYKQAKQHLKMTRRLHLSLSHKALIVVAIYGTVLYTMLFTTTPAVHDYFHALRHSLMMIPCH